MEYAATFGLSSWQIRSSPCYACCCTLDNICEDSDLNLLDFPWEQTTLAHYDAACARCEIKVCVTSELHRLIQPRLTFDRSERGNQGLVLSADVPSAGLKAGDRLEPSVALRDVHKFGSLTDFPVDVIFWRCCLETRARHRNPLLCEELGITMQTFLVDVLHALFLGVIKEFCMQLAWELIECDAWGVGAGRPHDELVAISVERMCTELFSWYDRHAQEHPEDDVTKMQCRPLRRLC